MYGQFIRDVRTSRGLSQTEVTRNAGIEQPNLSAYENDRQMPSLEMLNRILIGCGYLLEAVSGDRRLLCPLPGADPLAVHGTGASGRASRHGVGPAGECGISDDDMRATKLEQVLELADVLRESKAVS